MEYNKNEELKKLKLVIMSCSEDIPKGKEDLYEKSYHLWHKVWSKTLVELDGLKHLYSNEFTRHDFFSAIVRDQEPIGLFCYSTVNLAMAVRKNDSWFSSWPKDLLENIGQECQRGLMPAWLAVDPDYRRSKSNYPINLAQIVMETYARILVEYKYDCGFGTTRNNRGVDKLIYNTGGTKLCSSNDHGVDVDLVLMTPSNIKNKINDFSQESNNLWQNREDLWVKRYEQSISRAA